MYRTIFDAVNEYAEVKAEQLALADKSTAYTYKQLNTRVLKVANALHKTGASQDDFVLVECTQDTRFIIVGLACEVLGCIFVPFEKAAMTERVEEIYQDCNARVIVSDTEYETVGRSISSHELLRENVEMKRELYASNQNLCEVLFSTGTTGKPKGIMISHSANIAVAENIVFGTEMRDDNVEIVPLPLSHSHGLRTCYANLLNGSAVVIVDGIMNVALVFDLIKMYHVTSLDLTPTLAKLLLKVAKRGITEISNTIDYIELGTAVLEESLKDSLKELFPHTRLYNFYGSTEAGRCCVLDFNNEDYEKCIGYPSKNAVIFIADAKGEPIESSADNLGLIAVKGNLLMDGYLNDPEETKKALRNGAVYTNDLGYIDELGRVYVKGRADDIINYKGIKIAPEEIETVAIRFEGVLDCACVPKEDKICGQVPKIFVKVSDDTFDMVRYKVFLKENLDATRVPTSVEIIDSIPRTLNGKLQRKLLRDKGKFA